VKAQIIWADPVRDLFLSLPEREQAGISQKLLLLERFPYMFPVRFKGRRFRRHRWFHAGNWLVYYRVAGSTAYIRGLWAAQIP
jgi:hypothetical protein